MNSPPSPLSASQRGGGRNSLHGLFPLFAEQRGGKEGGEFIGIRKAKISDGIHVDHNFMFYNMCYFCNN
jgi:hypothetical protein